MKILIITTKDYYQLYDNWVKEKCDRTVSFINTAYTDREVAEPVKEFYIATENEDVYDFWNRKETTELKLLRHDIMNSSGDDIVLSIFVMPCIEIYQIRGTDSDLLQMKIKERQNYVSAIIDDVMCLITQNVSSEDIYIVAHDLDVFDFNADRAMRLDDLDKKSNLAKKIKENIEDNNSENAEDNKKCHIFHIYGFQHEEYNEMYSLLRKLFDDETPGDLITSIDYIMNESYQIQNNY